MIHASLADIRIELHRNQGIVREHRDRALEHHRTLLRKMDKVMEGLVRLKRPIYDDLEWHLVQYSQQQGLELMEKRLVLAEKKEELARQLRMNQFTALGGVLIIFITVWVLFGRTCSV